MKNPNDKTLKILLKSGQIINMYADEMTILNLKKEYEFGSFKDDGNEIFIRLNEIAAFEILDERKTSPKENPPSADVEPSQV